MTAPTLTSASCGKRKYEESPWLSHTHETALVNWKRSRRTAAAEPLLEHDICISDDETPTVPSTNGPGPSRRGLQKAAHKSARLKKERRAKWKQWCEEHRWERERDPDYKQKDKSTEVHQSDAMSYFRLKDYELATLPHTTFENEHSTYIPGRSYNLANLYTLVSRKSAFLAGVDQQPDPRSREAEFLKRGWQIFSAYTAKLEARIAKAGKKRKQLKFCVVFVRHPRAWHAPTHKVKPRPYGSWTTPVYEDGVRTGEWLNFQFDPEGDDGYYKRFVRFRPINADWDWDLV